MLRASIAVLVSLIVVVAGHLSQAACTNDCTTVSGGGPLIHGSGNVMTEERPVGPFNRLRLAITANVMIGGTGSQSLSVTADDNVLPLLISEVRNGTLVLSHKRGTSFEGKTPSFRITVSELRSIDFSGSGIVMGANLTGESLSISHSGSGRIMLAGQVHEVNLSLRGSGTIDTAKISAKQVRVVLSGSGAVTVAASDLLDVQLSGAGTVDYLGSPKIFSKVSGSGRVRQKSN